MFSSYERGVLTQLATSVALSAVRSSSSMSYRSVLFPGLIDTHVHVVLGHVDVWRLMQTPFSYRFYDAIRNLEATLRVGITTVRDAGGADLGVKQALEEGIVHGPRVQISITMLSQTGGHGDGWLPSGARSEIFPVYDCCPDSIGGGLVAARGTVRACGRGGEG